MKKLLLLTTIALLSFSFKANGVSVIRVTSDAVSGGTGETWENAMPLSEAIDVINSAKAATDETTLYLKTGDYQWTQIDRTITEGGSKFSIYGGFAGESNDEDLDSRNWAQNPVNITGEEDQAFILLRGQTFVQTMVLDGLNFTGGGGAVDYLFQQGVAGEITYKTNGHGLVQNCIFKNLVSDIAIWYANGGNMTNSSITFINCLFANNEPGTAIMGASAATLNIFCTTIAENTLTDAGAGITTGNANRTVNLISSILYGNTGATAINVDGNPTLNVNQSAADLDETGITLLSESPFADGGFQLDPINGAPCIDTGSDTYDLGTCTSPYNVLPEKDLACNSRIENSIVDMGAYEYSPSSLVSKIEVVNPEWIEKMTSAYIQLSIIADKITIYNCTGLVMNTFENMGVINTEKLTKGIYILEIKYQGKSLVRKFEK